MRSASWKDVEHKELFEQGEVLQVLSKLVRKHGIDLIVIGTGGRKGLGKLLLRLGSRGGLPQCRVPSAHNRAACYPLEIDGNLQHILFATDFGPEAVQALPYAISLAEENRARLTLLHMAPESGVALPEPEPGAMPVLDPSEVAASTVKQLRALIPEGTQLWNEPAYKVQFGSPAEMIVRIAEQTVDMIVLDVKRPAALTKHLGEGVAYKVACKASLPGIFGKCQVPRLTSTIGPARGHPEAPDTAPWRGEQTT